MGHALAARPIELAREERGLILRVRSFDIRPVVISREGEWRLPPRGWKAPARADPEDDADATRFDPHALDGWRVYPGPCEALVALREWQADVAMPVLHGPQAMLCPGRPRARRYAIRPSKKALAMA